MGNTQQSVLHALVGITATSTVIEFVDGIKCWDTLPLQRGELGNLMSQGITASLQEEAEEGIASSIDELLLYLSTSDKCLIPKEEYSQLCHLDGVLEDCGEREAWDGEFKACVYLGKKACITSSI